MKFAISRVSVSSYSDPGVPGAYKETRIPYEGSDNITEWFIDINSLQELVDLANEVADDLIISDGSITVYDDYME